MKVLALAVAGFATATICACSGGASSIPTSNGTTVSTPLAGATPNLSNAAGKQSSATFSINIPLTAGLAAAGRTAQYVSPSTSTVYISLQDSPGHGNAAFSYTEKIDSKSCTASSGTQSCTFVVSMPIGSDTFSVLTADAHNLPLAYATFSANINAGGSSATQGGQGQLSPIIASGTAQYAFAPILSATSSPVMPAMSLAAFDADGDLLSLQFTGNAPFGDALSSMTVTQSVGQFSENFVAHGKLLAASAPESTVVIAANGATAYLVELGDGTTNAFTTKVTVTTPAVQYTQAEFPQLPAPTLSIAASTFSLPLTCKFLVPAPTTDPCQGSASATWGLF